MILDIHNMSNVAPQINYKGETQSANPKYRFLRVPMNNLTGSSFTITGTTSQLIEFKMPNCVYNLSQSFLQYEVDTAAQGAGNYAWVAADSLEVASNCYFGSAGGLDICNLQYVNRYVKLWRKATTKASDMISNDATSQLVSCNTALGANYYPVTSTPSGNPTGVFNYIESQYLSAPSAANTAASYFRLFPLSGIPDTIFALNKDLYVPIDMYARFTIGPGNQFAFLSTANNAPQTGGAAITGNITINSCYLWLAVEQNQLIVDSVMNKVLSSGLSLNIPYTTAFRNSSTGTVANVSIPLNQQYGRRLKRMLYSVWNGTEQANTALDCSNYNGSKVVTYNTYMDNKQLQDLQISTAIAATGAFAQDDWRENNKYFADSAILNRAVYALNWMHVDQFYEPGSDANSSLQDNYDDGLEMKEPHLWQLQATTANATLTHYNFATFVRRIHIDRNGITYV